MNILYIAHRIPYPPYTGDKVRSFHQIRHLSRQHTVHLVCVVDEQQDLQYLKRLEEYCASVEVLYRRRAVGRFLAVSGLFTNKSLSVFSFYSRRLKRKINQRLTSQRFDSILVFSSAMAEYVRHVADIPKVIDFVDLDSEKWRLYAEYHPFPLSRFYRLEARRLGRYEEEVAQAFDHCIFVSEKEANLLRARASGRPVSVICNGVDLDYFSRDGYDRSSSEQPALVFTGAMDYFPNVDAVGYFCGKIFPLIREALPDSWFYIVGRNPTRRIRELARQPNVTVTGSVADVRPYLGRARVAVAPLRIARGVQNKVLEAMAMGVPVVGTSEAFQGTRATVADGIRTANDPEEFARAVLGFLGNAALRRECSVRARQYVQRHHRWEEHGACLESLLEEMIGERASRERFALRHGSR